MDEIEEVDEKIIWSIEVLGQPKYTVADFIGFSAAWYISGINEVKENGPMEELKAYDIWASDGTDRGRKPRVWKHIVSSNIIIEYNLNA